MLRLVRVDGGGPTPPAGSRIPLTSGVHPFGRGIFLDCEDKRVSRQHGQLEVSDKIVTLTALHLNPCFIIKKGSSSARKILKSGSSEVLECGDKFGVLPNSHWYELVSSEAPDTEDKTEEYENGGAAKTEEDKNEKLAEVNRADSPSLAQQNGRPKEDAPLEAGDAPTTDDADDEPINFPEEPEETNASAPGSPSLLGQNADATDNSAAPVPAASKRQHSTDAEDTSAAKQARTDDNARADEPEDVKPNISDLQAAVAAGPAAAADPPVPVKKEVKDEAGSSAPPPVAVQPATPLPPAAALGRERCIYGAQCYRRNPQHKMAFSHPSDSDWGPGAQGVCPWGMGCTRRDPRHWSTHSHPPGTSAPGPAGAGPNQPNRGDAKRPRKPRRKNRQGSTDDSQGVDPSNVLPSKRPRRTVRRPSYSGSESENEYDMDDPFITDGSEDWVPSDGDIPSDYTQSQ